MLIAVYLGERSVGVVLLVVTEASDQVGEDNLQVSLVSKVLASVSTFEFLQNPGLVLEVKEKVQVVVVTEIVPATLAQCHAVSITCADIVTRVAIPAPPYCNSNWNTNSTNSYLNTRTASYTGLYKYLYRL